MDKIITDSRHPLLMTTNANGHHVQTRQLQQQIQSIIFDTSASIDTKGIISLHSKVRNRSPFGKRQIRVTLRVLNKGEVVYLLDSGYITLRGITAGVFVPTKKSSTVINTYGNISFEDLSVDDPNAPTTDPDIVKMDRDISELAGKIRRAKVLMEAQRDDGQNASVKQEFQSLVEQMTERKNARMKKLKEIELINKFQSISLDIQHEVTNGTTRN